MCALAALRAAVAAAAAGAAAAASAAAAGAAAAAAAPSSFHSHSLFNLKPFSVVQMPRRCSSTCPSSWPTRRATPLSPARCAGVPRSDGKQSALAPPPPQQLPCSQPSPPPTPSSAPRRSNPVHHPACRSARTGSQTGTALRGQSTFAWRWRKTQTPTPPPTAPGRAWMRSRAAALPRRPVEQRCCGGRRSPAAGTRRRACSAGAAAGAPLMRPPLPPCSSRPRAPPASPPVARLCVPAPVVPDSLLFHPSRSVPLMGRPPGAGDPRACLPLARHRAALPASRASHFMTPYTVPSLYPSTLPFPGPLSLHVGGPAAAATARRASCPAPGAQRRPWRYPARPKCTPPPTHMPPSCPGGASRV